MSVLKLSNSESKPSQIPDAALPSWLSIPTRPPEAKLHPYEPRRCVGISAVVDHGRMVGGLFTSGKLKRKRSTGQLCPSLPSNSHVQNNASVIFPSEEERSMDKKLVIVMVGLPARGKSYVTKKICRYLNWLQHDTKIFNVGNRRRMVAVGKLITCDLIAAHCSKPTQTYQASLDDSNQTSRFFDPDNLQAGRLRERVAMETLDELLDYLLNEGGSVAIFDATNSTIERRRMIIKKVQERGGSNLQVLFLESQCFDQALLQSNMRLKLSSPDYKDQDPVKASEDFQNRVAMYEKKYIPLGDIEERLGVSYCQMIDVGRKFITHNINGFLATQVISYLQHFNLAGRQVWLTRHGEFEDDFSGKISSDPSLNPHGVKYATALSQFIDHERDVWNLRQNEPDEAGHSLRTTIDRPPKGFHLWTSMVQQSVQTAKFFDRARYRIEHMRMLDDLNAEILDELSDAEAKQLLSETQQDKISTRYPGTRCEGYSDVTKRLQSVILELERVTGHVLIIGGLAVIRVLLAYCRGMHKDVIANLDIPLGTVYMLEPKPYGVEYKEFDYHPQTNWFAQKC